MAALESYSPCPCGSGQKYKWCCQKAEPFVERSVRLQETGGVEASRRGPGRGPGEAARQPLAHDPQGHTSSPGRVRP